GDLEDMTITIAIFGGKAEKIDIANSASAFSGHSGGDKRMIKDLINNVKNKSDKIALTDIFEALESHQMAFKAEESRLSGGQVKSI
ncbi:MAG: gfo/Idh/MocA family oxidoreductase, partial [Bacilli bacterium]